MTNSIHAFDPQLNHKRQQHHNEMKNEDYEIDLLWEELNQQQSRETQNHQNLVHNNILNRNNKYPVNHLHNDNKTSSFDHFIDQTSTALTTAANVAISGVKSIATSAGKAIQNDAISRRIGMGIGIRGGHDDTVLNYNGPYADQRYNNVQYKPPSIDNPSLAEFGLHTTHSDYQSSLLSNDYLQEHEGEGEEDTFQTGTNTKSNNNNNIIDENTRKFVLLDQFRLSPKKEGWGAVANLDLFFTSLYNYYYHRGIVPLIGKGIVDLISLFFTLWLSTFIFAYLDWYALAKCTDSDTCDSHLQNYIIEKPFSNLSIWNLLVILYMILFTIYGLFSIISFLSSVRDGYEAKYIFEDKLGISARKLEGGAVEWNDIVQKILTLQKSGEYRVAIHEKDIKDELMIAQRILRRENFMIAFFNANMFDLTIPLPWPLGVAGRSTTRFYSKSLEWSIYFCVLSYMFNHRYHIRPAFYIDPNSLQRRFIFCGIVHIIFMPFLLFFMTLHFFMQNVYDFRSSKQYLGPRDWSSIAKWTFREFNELPHVFERRLGPSYKAADNYLKLFTSSSVLHACGRAIVFVSGSLGAVCLALAAVNDAILLHVKIGNWNLLWYVGMLGVAYSFGKGLLPDEDIFPKYHHNLFAEMDNALVEVASHTHYYPEFWKKRGWDDLIKKSFTDLFQYKAQLFIMEVCSVMVAPLVLCFSLPRCAVDICNFVRQIKIEVPGVGDHCGFATFDFDLFEDENWEGKKIGAEHESDCIDENFITPKRGDLNTKLNLSDRPKARQGKMEKSFFNFKSVHPGWKCSSSGQDLVDRMESYKMQQALALAKERQHHVAAAIRQLEVLQKLEEIHTAKHQNETANLAVIKEDYIPKNNESNLHHPSDTADTAEGEMPNNKVNFRDGSQEKLPYPMSNSHTFLSRPSTSVLHYNDIGLSMELQRILNNSTLDPTSSFAGSCLGTEIDLSLAHLSTMMRSKDFSEDD